MLRVADGVVLLAPLALLALYLMTARRGGPSRGTLALLLTGLVLCGGILAWYALHERLPAGARYVPAQVRDGVLIPGHGG